MTVIDFNTARRQNEPHPNSVDADDIRVRLHADPRAFITWLYSGRAYLGKTDARIGDVYGTPGASLSIALTGPDKGFWKDHATDEGGDLIALYRAAMGYRENSNFVLSLKEIAKEYFDDPVEVERAAWQPTAIERIEKKKIELGTKPRSDLIELGAPVRTFTYYDVRGNVIASVVRYEPDGTRESKTFRPYCFRTIDGVTKWIAGTPDLRPLYRIPDIALSQTVVLCEGEGCADALTSVGIPATSAMQGAHAPIDKTDWSPLAGKTVIVWPDNDQPGFDYANRAAARLAALGCQVKGVTPPPGSPDTWDAADAVAEGKDVAGIVAGAIEISNLPMPRKIRVFNFSALATEEFIEEPDYLSPDMIGPGTFMLVAGPPKAQKSWLVQDINIALATGGACLGGMLSAPTPLKVFYLQAEMNEKLLRRRARAAHQWLIEDDIHLLKSNLLVSDRFRMILNDDGVEATVALIKSAFSDGPPDVLTFDPLINLFDQENESDNAQMMKFLQLRIEVVRERINPRAAIIMVHHATKKSAEDIRKDPFLIIRGAGALRGHYDTGLVIFRKSEETEEREIHFDLRAAESPKAITAQLVNGTFRHLGTVGSEASEVRVPDGIRQKILNEIDRAWRLKAPMSFSPQTRREGRYAPFLISKLFNVKPSTVEKLIQHWLDTGILIVETTSSHTKSKGLKLRNQSAEVAEVSV